MPKISVLIPVYNTEDYLSACLDSVCGQTLQDIEIICVNDCSTDNALQILNEYAQKDSRIQVFSFPKNSGLVSVRKKGIEQATGQYILFVDSDDWIQPETCEKLYETAVQHDVDVVHFGTQIAAVEDTDKNQIESMLNFMKPCYDAVDANDLLTECYVNQKFAWNLCNKLFRASILKEIHSDITDKRIVYAEDAYLFALYLSHAQGYIGVPDVYYNYRFGAGGYGSSTISLQKFEKTCSQKVVIDELQKHFEKQSAGEEYPAWLKKLKERFATDVFWNYAYLLAEQDKPAGLKMMLDTWGYEDVALGIQLQTQKDAAQIDFLKNQFEQQKRYADEQNKYAAELKSGVDFLNQQIEQYKKQLEATSKALEELRAFHEECEVNSRRAWIEARGELSRKLYGG